MQALFCFKESGPCQWRLWYLVCKNMKPNKIWGDNNIIVGNSICAQSHAAWIETPNHYNIIYKHVWGWGVPDSNLYKETGYTHRFSYMWCQNLQINQTPLFCISPNMVFSSFSSSHLVINLYNKCSQQRVIKWNQMLMNKLQSEKVSNECFSLHSRYNAISLNN